MSDLSPESPAAAVSLRLTLPVSGPGSMAFSVALAGHMVGTESLTMTDGNGDPVPADVVLLGNGTRMHVVEAPRGDLSIQYDAVSCPLQSVVRPVTENDRLVYLRPSRYCPSDRIAGLAANEFGGLEGPRPSVQAITQWIHSEVAYVVGVTDAGDDALHPLLTRQGVCRDFAHLGVALCRAVGIPARYVSVYAPGLYPMDAHAVFEAEVDGVWRVFDATRLAPRKSMVRIATGRDAADAALVSPIRALIETPEMDLTVTAHPDLPDENWEDLVTLG